MNIFCTMAVNGIPLPETPIVEARVSSGAAVQVTTSPEESDHDTEQATPVIPLGSSVLAPGLEAALEF